MNGFFERHGIVRNAIRKDILQFALPGITVFSIELLFCARDVIKQLQTPIVLPWHGVMGLVLVVMGLAIMTVSQATLWRNYSGTVLIRKDHRLITHGIYRFTRNPIYLGLIVVVTGLPVYAASLYGFLAMLGLIPIILSRIRLEEKLLTEEFQDAYQEYKETTRKLIPFIY